MTHQLKMAQKMMVQAADWGVGSIARSRVFPVYDQGRDAVLPKTILMNAIK